MTGPSEPGSPRRAVCPGSYDPVTHGHLDVLVRAAGLFDEVIAAVLHNPTKAGTFTAPERMSLLRDTLVAAGVASRVRVEAFAGRLLVDVCRDLGAGVVLKGLRGGTDFAYEVPMALMNRQLTGVETVFLPGAPEWEHVSSSLVKEVVRYGGDVAGMVPEPVRLALEERLRG